MKIFALSSVLTLSAVASAAFVPQATRLRRDVSELGEAAEYLPPATEYLPPEQLGNIQLQPEAEVEAEPASAVLGDAGYEYRAVRRLKLRHRNRRDVSHLPRQYLPPNMGYLPPAAPAVSAEPVAPAAIDDTEEVISAAEPKLARDYLPPAEELVNTEAPTTEAPIVSEEPVELAEQPLPDVRIADVPQPSAELLDDGYHYKKPAELPALREASKEYLPPSAAQDEPAPVVEGPANGESAVLAKDGYHYRAVKRFRF